jgi:hypothetical protein
MPHRGKLPSVSEVDGRKSSDDLGALAASDANADALRVAAARVAELERQLTAARAPAFPPPVVQRDPTPGNQAPVTTEPVDPAETELVAGYRRGRKAMGAIGWVFGALAALGAVGSAGVIGGQVALNPRPAKEANLDDASKRLRAVESWRNSVERWQRGDYADRALKERLQLDFLCQQGFRAPHVDCAAIRDQARDEARRGESSDWPDPRKPPPLPDPEAP